MQYIRLLFLCLLMLGPLPSLAYACPIPQKCDQFWVAAQNVGVPLSFFSEVRPARDAALLRVGDRLLSTTNMNLRRRAGDFASPIIGTMAVGSSVLVEDLKTISTSKGDQIWLRVRVSDKAIKFNEEAGQPVLTEVAQKVVACFRRLSYAKGTATIQGMYECSDRWVTPRALLLCSIGATCPVLEDTVSGRAMMDAFLKEDQMTTASPLKLIDRKIPRLPSLEAITRCRGQTSGEKEFQLCAAKEMSSSYQAVFECSKKFTEGEKLACLATQTQDAAFKSLVACLAGGRPSPDKVVACAANPRYRQQADEIRECVTSAENGREATECVLQNLDGKQRELAECVVRIKKAEGIPGCLANQSSEYKRLAQLATCLDDAADHGKRAACLARSAGGDVAKATACLTKGGGGFDIAVCALDGTPEGKVVGNIMKCAKRGKSVDNALVNCAAGFLDDKSRTAVGCVAGASGDPAKLAACAAATVLPEDAARLVGCASSSQGPTSFALCVAGPSMNEEWRIAAECAASSGGEPLSFAGCTAGRLTVRELTKCLTGRVGEDCFGPNNTIVKTLNNAYSDLTKGPGENNDIVVAIRAISQISGGPNSVVNNPGQIWGGDNSVFNNPGQILGGDNSVFNNPSQLEPRNWRF